MFFSVFMCYVFFMQLCLTPCVYCYPICLILCMINLKVNTLFCIIIDHVASIDAYNVRLHIKDFLA